MLLKYPVVAVSDFESAHPIAVLDIDEFPPFNPVEFDAQAHMVELIRQILCNEMLSAERVEEELAALGKSYTSSLEGDYHELADACGVLAQEDEKTSATKTREDMMPPTELEWRMLVMFALQGPNIRRRRN